MQSISICQKTRKRKSQWCYRANKTRSRGRNRRLTNRANFCKCFLPVNKTYKNSLIALSSKRLVNVNGRIFTAECFSANSKKVDRACLIYSENYEALFCFPFLLFTKKKTFFFQVQNVYLWKRDWQSYKYSKRPFVSSLIYYQNFLKKGKRK